MACHLFGTNPISGPEGQRGNSKSMTRRRPKMLLFGFWWKPTSNSDRGLEQSARRRICQSPDCVILLDQRIPAFFVPARASSNGFRFSVSFLTLRPHQKYLLLLPCSLRKYLPLDSSTPAPVAGSLLPVLWTQNARTLKEESVLVVT